VIESGQVAETGTHEELLAAGGLYADLYLTQFKYQESQDRDRQSERERDSAEPVTPFFAGGGRRGGGRPPWLPPRD
jgi:ATP-binding cassette subfamily B protein